MQSITVGVAQLVEPRIVIPVVVGSIPIAHPSLQIRAFRPHPHPFPRREKGASRGAVHAKIYLGR